MNYNKIIIQLIKNKDIFKSLLKEVSVEEYLWKEEPNRWCILETICHLRDEEREDFRARLKHVLETPTLPLPQIDPSGWVKKRKYIEQDYYIIFKDLKKERDQSYEWLKSLFNPKWDNAFKHPKYGAMTAKMFLTNWLAHDYLHIRQIIKLKFNFLKQLSGESLIYAGNL